MLPDTVIYAFCKVVVKLYVELVRPWQYHLSTGQSPRAGGGSGGRPYQTGAMMGLRRQEHIPRTARPRKDPVYGGKGPLLKV